MGKGRAMDSPVVLVYRNQPLPISESFVYNQSMLLRRYKAFFLGAKYPVGPHIALPEDRVRLINTGGAGGLLREASFKLVGYVPRDVIDWAERLRPVLIHAHFGPDGAMVLPLAAKLDLPLVVSFLGTDATLKDEYARHSYVSQRLYLLRRARLVRHVTRVVVPSDFLRDRVMEQGFQGNQIELIAHGVDLSEFKPDAASSPEWGHVLYVGRLVQRKGLQLLIEALAHVREHFPNVRLTVIGDGPMRGQYQAQAANRLGADYSFLGAQPQDVVRDYLKKAYLLSMPSITMPSGEAETFGLVFVEAHAMGVPVVSFAAGGVSEVVAHGETGFLAAEGNVGELASYMERLLEQPDLRDRMGKAGRERVERFFDLDKQNARLESLYDRVVMSSPDGDRETHSGSLEPWERS